MAIENIENKVIKSRIDTASNWTNKNPKIQPGEICFTENSTDFKVNVGSSEQPYESCTTFKGTDTTAAAANDSRITVYNFLGTELGSFTLNQSNNGRINLPNFVGDAKVQFPTEQINRFLGDEWTKTGQSINDSIPNCIPVDLVLVILREFAVRLEKNGTNAALEHAKSAITDSLNYVNLK